MAERKGETSLKLVGDCELEISRVFRAPPRVVFEDCCIPGKGNAPVVLPREDKLPDLSPQQMREYLIGLAARVARERRETAALTAPPERPSVKDW